MIQKAYRTVKKNELVKVRGLPGVGVVVGEFLNGLVTVEFYGALFMEVPKADCRVV